MFALADEIHADLTLPLHEFVPFVEVAAGTGLNGVATHGPIKTFGLAEVCDTLAVTDRDETAERFRSRSSQFHLTRNNVLALATFEADFREAPPDSTDSSSSFGATPMCSRNACRSRSG